MSKHTPGPWTAHLAPQGGFEIEKDPNELGRYMVLATRSPHEARAGEMHANAHLIAAAPELLAVLQELEESCGYWSEYDVPLGIVDRIRSAISKAKGGSHV